MSDWPHLIQTLLGGVLSGGATAGTTVLTYLKDQRTRLEALEGVIGTPGSSVKPKTGIFVLFDQHDQNLTRLQESLRKLKTEVDGWSEDPPAWVFRAVNRRSTLPDPDDIGLKVQRLGARLEDLQDQLNKLGGQLKTLSSDYVDRNTYEDDTQERATQIRRIEADLARATGFLEGVMTTLDYKSKTIPPGKKKGPIT